MSRLLQGIHSSTASSSATDSTHANINPTNHQTKTTGDSADIQSTWQNFIKSLVDGGGTSPNATTQHTNNHNHPKDNNPSSLLESLQSGPSINLSQLRLSSSQIKLATLVITGSIRLPEMETIILSLLDSPQNDLTAALHGFVTHTEMQRRTPNQGSRRSGRRHFLIRDHPDNHHSPSSGNDWRGNRHHKSDAKPNRNNPYTPAKKNAVVTHGHNPLSPQSTPSPDFTRRRKPLHPPSLSVINLSCTGIGNSGIEMLSEVLYENTHCLKTMDISFCSIKEGGMLALCRAIRKRRTKGLPSLQALILSGNFVTYKAAKELGLSLSTTEEKRPTIRKRSQISRKGPSTGYVEDGSSDDEDDEEADDDILFCGNAGTSNNNVAKHTRKRKEGKAAQPHTSGTDASNSSGTKCNPGLQLLHIACASLSPDALYQLLVGLGPNCPLKELNIASNNIGPSGATLLVAFLEGKGIQKYKKDQPVMPSLDRMDLSNNNIGNDGTAKLTRAISKRVKVSIIDLRLSSNSIGDGGIETILNKLLHHNLVSLSLDNNAMGDRGCQLVAASLPSMHYLSRLNLSFNQIGSRGVTTLMRALIGCESITFLGLSGNVMKISGAIAMGFTLSQHPRLADLELDNCCLSQVAQCHIVAGIISNRWVPMKKMVGFRAGPPMVAIGALEVLAQHLTNLECFRIRRDMQMKSILQWMETTNRSQDAGVCGGTTNNFIAVDCVESMRDSNGPPHQSAYIRMLDWLSRIPFDEDELTELRRYFYDVDGDSGDGMRGSDGNINLKHRGDLLAALGSEIADEIRDANSIVFPAGAADVGLDLSSDADDDDWHVLDVLKYGSPSCSLTFKNNSNETTTENQASDLGQMQNTNEATPTAMKNKDNTCVVGQNDMLKIHNPNTALIISSSSKQSVISRSGSEKSATSQGERSSTNNAPVLKTRISMFPQFGAKLDMLKASAQDMMDQEDDTAQQDIIAQQFAEASLTLLRQLRYHCMNSGLDGWRQGRIRRKVLIVDDSVVTRKMVARAFEKANFIVDTANNGMEGVAKLKESIYDIAFMDIDMPVMNGFDATRALRLWEDSIRPGARQPICALTAAYVDDFERSELMKFKEAGLDVMESKPCNIPRLFKVVDDVSPMFSDLSISVTQLDTTAIH